MSIIPGEYDPSTVPELKTIDLKEETVPGQKRLCRIGAAVTNEEFRRWAVAGKAWSLPADVILVLLFFFGSSCEVFLQDGGLLEQALEGTSFFCSCLCYMLSPRFLLQY